MPYPANAPKTIPEISNTSARRDSLFIFTPTKDILAEPIKSFDFSMKRPLHRKVRLVLIRRVILRTWWEPLGLCFCLSVGGGHSARRIRIGGRRRLSPRLFHQSFPPHPASNRFLLQASEGKRRIPLHNKASPHNRATFRTNLLLGTHAHLNHSLLCALLF